MAEFIPNFDGKFKGSVTCGQFIASIEEHALNEQLTEEDVKALCLTKLSGVAVDVFQSNITKSWIDLKSILMDTFSVKLTITEKVKLRKELKQDPSEEIDDFYHRCLQVQYLVSDDVRDVAFEREVLLNFLLGLHHTIQENVLTANCSSGEEFILEAKKHFVVPKYESFVPEVKVEPSDDYDYDYGYDYNDTFKDEPGEFEEMDDMAIEDEDDYDEDYEPNENEVPLKKKKDKDNDEAPDKKRFKCPIWYRCYKVFRTQRGVDRHVSQNHKSEEKTCDFCQQVFPEVHSLTKHIVLTHCSKNEKDQFVCCYCQQFHRKFHRSVTQHIMYVHFEMKDVYFTCPTCEKVFEHKTFLATHIRVNHQNVKAHQCDKCPKVFATIGGLRSHIQCIHDPQSTMKCEKCDKTFGNKYRYHYHLKQEHGNIEKAKCICDLCGATFVSKHNLADHKRTQHISETEKEKMMISCKFDNCQYKSLTKQLMKTHEKRVHLKIKDHVCPHCGKGFAARYKIYLLVEFHQSIPMSFCCLQKMYGTTRQRNSFRTQKLEMPRL